MILHDDQTRRARRQARLATVLPAPRQHDEALTLVGAAPVARWCRAEIEAMKPAQ